MSSEGPPPQALIPRRRLHPAEILLGALDNIREAFIGLVVVIVLGAGGLSAIGALALALVGVIVAGVAGYLRWNSTFYEVQGGSLRFRSGILSPDETSVPLGRIGALDSTQGPIQRLFGVLALQVQTAGGGSEGEIVLRAMSSADAHQLRAAAGLPDPVTSDLPEWRLRLPALLATALTAPQFGVVLPLLAGSAAFLDDLLGEGLRDRLPDEPGEIALAAVALTGAAWLLSFAGALIAFAGFTAARDDNRLRIRRGVLSRRAASLPLARVHAVEVVEGLVRRPFGLATVRIQTAGYRDEQAAAQTLLPLVRVADIDRVLGELVPALSGGLGELQRPPPRAARRYALPEALAGGALGAVITAAWPSAWPAVVVLALAGGLDGLQRYRSAGWRLAGGRLAVRRRVIARRTLVARADRLQEHSLRVSPLQRRARLATLGVAVGSGRRGRVAQLELDVAARLFERLRPARG
ncbi:MAG TPA: PH domain-containing protein [Thermoleophilaceae bacterium]|nr:PH domain-containing protein [Thermoleophilaceae bacterium]